MTDSQDLLAEYRQNGSDAAFRELVTRFVDLVYSTALRLVGGDTHSAEDVTQTVFVDLPRLARTLSSEVRLGGWLHRHTCFVAANTMRGERRRQARERQAVEMNALQNHSETDFSRVAPLLDEAINELGEADRTAILLRFFEQHDFRAVGQALGSNEDAARMRVTHALEKLEDFLKRRGVTTSAASLGVVLTANAVQAAPVGLAVTISTAATLAGTTLAATAIKTIAMTTLQKAIIGAAFAAAVGGGIYEARQNSELRDKNESLQQQTAQLKRQASEAGTNPVSGAMADAMQQAMEQQTEGRLSRMTASLQLTPEQVQAARDILMRQSQAMSAGMAQAFSGKFDKEELTRLSKAAGNPDDQIKALLTPDQKGAYPSYQQEEAAHNARQVANTELLQLQSTLGLTSEQQDRAFAALYEVSSNQLTGKATLATPAAANPAEQMQWMQWASDQKAKALAA